MKPLEASQSQVVTVLLPHSNGPMQSPTMERLRAVGVTQDNFQRRIASGGIVENEPIENVSIVRAGLSFKSLTTCRPVVSPGT